MIWAYNRAPLEPIWVGLRWLPAVVMPFSFVLLACGLLSRNPTAVGAARLLKNPEPAHGIIRVTRHPVMWAFILWSLAHLLARGELMASVFFGGFLVAGGARRPAHGPAQGAHPGRRLAALRRRDLLFPVRRHPAGPQPLRCASEIGWRNPAIGLALYALFFWFHPMLFGIRAYG